MEISVFGGKGFVGGEFCRRFQEQDNLLIVPRERRTPVINSTEILYLISTTHNYNVFESTTKDVETNLIVLCEVLDEWRKNCPDATFNFISSWFVYGDSDPVCKESSPCNPKGFYSITKRAAEQLVISYCETFGLKYRILRLGNVLGNNDTNVSAKKNALQYLINQMKEGNPIEIYEHGDFYRNYIHVEDAVEAIHCVMEKGDTNQIYNIGRLPNVHFQEAIDYCHEKLNSKSHIRFIEQKGFHKSVQTKSFMMDVTKLYRLGFEPKYTTHQMLDTLLT